MQGSDGGAGRDEPVEALVETTDEVDSVAFHVAIP
jgi:hypothetical protein